MRWWKWLLLAVVAFYVYRVVRLKNAGNLSWSASIHSQVPIIGAFFKDDSGGVAGKTA